MQTQRVKTRWNLGGARSRLILLRLSFVLAICGGGSFAEAKSLPVWSTTPDHAPLDERHVHTLERFLDRHLRDQGVYQVHKVDQFIARLEQEKKSLLQDIYETTIIEKLELEFKTYPEALEDAQDEAFEEKNNLAQGYNEYLIPTMEKLRAELVRGAPQSELDALMDSFKWIYSSYFNPEYDRNLWNADFPLTRKLKERVFGFHFPRKASKQKVEANNLRIPAALLTRAGICLGRRSQHSEDAPLTEVEVQRLAHCGIDISLLDPMPNPLMQELSPEQFQKARMPNLDLFPDEEAEFQFTGVRYSSKGSVKLNVTYMSGNKKLKYKVKMGPEVHNEIASTYLSQMLGLHQDPVIFRKSIKVNLGKKWTWEKFQRAWERKYVGNQKFIHNFVVSHGGTPGKEWVILRDVLLEAKAPNKIRLEGFHPDSWDLPNRREFRAMLLFYGWLDIKDTKAGNHVVQLVKTPAGLVPELSLQDVGHSLRLSMAMDPGRLAKFFAYQYANSSVNSFGSSFLDWDAEGIRIRWGDLAFSSDRFGRTTVADLVWMARKIARLQTDDIEVALRVSGMPPSVQKLYLLKIAHRRDEIVQAFGLEAEFPRFALPHPDSYSELPEIRNGKIAEAALPSSARFEGPKETLFPMILGLVHQSFDVPELGEKLKLDIGKFLGATSTIGVSEKLTRRSNEVGFDEVSSGIQVAVRRNVGFHPDWVARGADTSTYFVRDTVRISLVVGAGASGGVVDNLPLKLQASARLYTREYEVITYAPSWQEGWTRPFLVFQAMFDLNEFVATRLGPQEVVKVSEGYGLDVSGTVPLFTQVPLIKSEISAQLKWAYSRPLYFYRDAYAELHVYRASEKEMGFALGITPVALDLWILDIPLIDLGIQTSRFSRTGELFTFKLPSYEHRGSPDELGEVFLGLERRALDDFMAGIDSPSVLLRRDLKLKASGTGVETYFRLFFLVNESNRHEYSGTRVEMADGTVRRFHRYLSQNTGFTGVDFEGITSPRGTFHFTFLKRDASQTIVEWDQDHPLSSTIVVYNNNYKNMMDRPDLERWIGHFNRLYSKSEGEPFFHNYLLPEEVKKYYKVATTFRIFIKASDLLARIHNSDPEEFALMAKARFPRRLYNPVDWYEYEQVKGILSKYQRIIQAMRRQSSYDHALIVEALADLVDSLQMDKLGTGLLQDWLGDQSFMVTGEVYGIYPSFTSLQADEQTAGRRFAGRHWGTYPGMSPLRKFYNEHRLGPVSNFIDQGSLFETLFGEAPSVETPGPR